jgi:hypothetical protein
MTKWEDPYYKVIEPPVFFLLSHVKEKLESVFLPK